MPGFVGLSIEGLVRGVGGVGRGLIDHAVTLLPGEEVVVTLKEDRDTMLDHELMDGQLPSRAFLAEFPGAVVASSAPFIEIRHLHAAAPCTQDMMREHEFVLSAALLECVLEPLVLCVAHTHGPPVAASPPGLAASIRSPGVTPAFVTTCGVYGHWRMPVRVHHHKQGIAPGPCVVIPEKPNRIDLFGIARVECVRRRQRIETCAGSACEHGRIIRCVVQEVSCRLLMIAIDQEQGG